MAAYEVLLLNTAIPQIQAAQSGDTYVVPRDIAFSAALTLSAGTANGVPYLNASKVLTTGSALTFDGTTLGVSSGGATPALRVFGAGTSQGQLQFGSTNGYLIQGGADYLAINFNTNNATRYSISDTGISTWYVGGSEQMRLTSTGLGIGTSSPGHRLDVTGAAGTFAGIRVNASSFQNAGLIANRVNNGNTAALYFTESGANQAYIMSYGSAYGSGLNGALQIVNGSNALTLDASGNLVVGGTAAINTAVNRGNITINGTSSSILVLGTGGTERGYFYTQGTDIICNSSTGSFTVQTGGANPVIFGTNNTEAARITSDRNLLVGETSSNSGNNGLKVKGQFALTTSQAFTASGSVNDSAYYIVCYSLSATCTLTLPTPANNTGRLLNIVVQSAQQVVSASSNVTAITNGALGTAILPATAGKWAQLWCDGTYWNIIATNV